MKLRLFLGPTAPEGWKLEIKNWRRGAEKRFGRSFARWTTDENLHLTLRFFGNVDDGEVVGLGKALQKVAAETRVFSVTAGGLGCFPNASRVRIVWLGFEGSTGDLVDLERRVRAGTASFGQAPEDREFHPHLTLARVKEANREDRKALAELIQRGRVIEAPAWQISELELIRSELKPGGSVYTTLVRYAFRP